MPRRLPKLTRSDQPPRARPKDSSVGVAAFDELLQRWAKQPPPEVPDEAPKEPKAPRKRAASATKVPRATRSALAVKQGVYPACQPPDLERCSVLALKAFLQQARVPETTIAQAREKKELQELAQAHTGAWEVARVLACASLPSGARPAAVLRVAAGAGQEDVRSAFRRLSLLVHPDKHRSCARAAEAFKTAKEAFDALILKT